MRRLCKWLGSSERNVAFNRVMRYALTESARFCPSEDHSTDVANVPGWNWYPEPEPEPDPEPEP